MLVLDAGPAAGVPVRLTTVGVVAVGPDVVAGDPGLLGVGEIGLEVAVADASAVNVNVPETGWPSRDVTRQTTS